jgi:hypothetical protein
MSKEINPLEAMLSQYENNNKPKYEKSTTAKVYDLKNYFNTYIEDSVKSATKEIRILPTADGSSPFVEMHGHKIKVGKDNKIFPCLKHEKGEACPFCEAREALLATDKESDKEIAKKYGSRLYYIVKVIDRNFEEEGVKFWRFPHDYSHKGIFDKIQGVLMGLKKDRDFTSPTNGRDLAIMIGRDQNNYPMVTTITNQDPTPLSEDAEKAKTWLADTRTWEDVYSVRNYDYLEIIVTGDTPVWNNVSKKFVSKEKMNNIGNASDTSESEITLGVENVKSNIKASTKANEKVVSSDESDDLPF